MFISSVTGKIQRLLGFFSEFIDNTLVRDIVSDLANNPGQEYLFQEHVMASRYANNYRFILMAVAALLIVPTYAFAQGGAGGGAGGGGAGGGGVGGGVGGIGNNLFLGVVGGVAVDADRVVRGDYKTLPAADRAMIRKALASSDADISNATDLRMISLKGLNAAIEASVAAGKPLSAEIQYMAGLQRIEYVILSEDKSDIIIAGPGEGWKTDDNGNVVGEKSGMPVIHLQDFLVAMRAVDNARQGQGVSVSIDPTAEGMRKWNEFSSGNRFNPNMKAAIEEAVGPQQVSLTGVPKDSHFSRVLLAADYKMKRLAMGLEASPLKKLPSMMEVINKRKLRVNRSAPRMWMECSYEPVAKDADGTVWKLSGQGVRTQTEDTKFAADGSKVRGGSKMAVAEAWAKNMTKHYDELSAKEPVFRDLRNVMDMSVVAAIIRNEDLTGRVGLELDMIVGNKIQTPSYEVPEAIPTQLSYVHSNTTGYTVQVSGGVLLDSWSVAQNTIVKPEVASVAAIATVPTANRWWWNAKN